MQKRNGTTTWRSDTKPNLCYNPWNLFTLLNDVHACLGLVNQNHNVSSSIIVWWSSYGKTAVIKSCCWYICNQVIVSIPEKYSAKQAQCIFQYSFYLPVFYHWGKICISVLILWTRKWEETVRETFSILSLEAPWVRRVGW